MNERKIEILSDTIERDLLPFVQQPARYIGGEINQVKKNLTECELAVTICFPDVYEVGMSNNGIAILYSILNDLPNVAAERCFAPWTDAEKIMREKNIELFTLESKASLKSTDVIGFNLTTELCVSNVLNILDLAGLELRSDKRKEADPLIIAGGSFANSAEPLAPFIDLFVLGDGEEAIVELAEIIIKHKRQKSTKETLLRDISTRYNWAYVPGFYEFKYENQHITEIKSDFSVRFENAVVEDFENAQVPLKPIVPFVEAIHERVSIEIMRGCPGRCRFCQASFCKRPIRCKSAEKIVEIAQKAQKNTGFDTVSLLSLSTADYPHLESLTEMLDDYFKDKYVGISLPSLRVDKQLKLLPKMVNTVRKAGLTIAVEAAPFRLRRIVNKPLKNEDLFEAVEAAYRAGWQRLKLYFMAGLPGETIEDVREIVPLCCQLADIRKKVDGKRASINAAVSWFVPKPHTPFGTLGQATREYFAECKKMLIDEKMSRRARFINFKFHSIDASCLEAAIARGDRRTADVIETAFENGARFDLWSETFDVNIWKNAFETHGLDMDVQAQKQFDTDKTSPWDHLGGPDKKDLMRHLKDSQSIMSDPE